jgi:hypothetical protein
MLQNQHAAARETFDHFMASNGEMNLLCDRVGSVRAFPRLATEEPFITWYLLPS